jgi:ABC-type sugar transport system substrate-binding protein
MASGAVAAVNAAGKKGQILVTGYDLTDQGIQFVKDGSQALDVGVLAADYTNVIYVATDMIQGTFTSPHYTNEGVYSVTAASVADFLKIRMDKLGY